VELLEEIKFGLLKREVLISAQKVESGHPKQRLKPEGWFFSQ